MENGKFVPRPLEVFAIGAGPNAVGSAAVTINRFAPVSTGRRADYTIVFNKKRQFDYLRANLVERRASNGGFQRTMVAKRDLCTDASGRDLCVNGPPSFPYETAGEWPEKPGKQLDKRRMYHMELRAWSRRGPASGWLIGQAPRALQWP
jgi:hypothetical protein